MEEYIGKVWGKYITKKTSKLHEKQRVYFTDMSKSLYLFYHLMGGEKGKDLQITDKRHINTSRTFLQKISFLGQDFYLTWQDEKSVYLPASCAFFPTLEQNKMLYFWLVSLVARVDVHAGNVIKENQRATQELLKRYSGFKFFHKEACSYLIEQYPELLFVTSLENKDVTSNYPFPLWVYPSLSSRNKANSGEDEDENFNRDTKNTQTDTLDMKKQAKQIDDTKKTDGFLSFLPESMMNIMEQINVDRAEDDRFNEDALYHAEDLDEITLGKKSANLSARIKIDLDLQPDISEIYPLGKGHFIDEWDYRTKQYLKNYVCIKPQITLNVEPISLPKRLEKMVNKIQHELDLLKLDRIKNDNLPYGDEININTWIEYKSHQNKSMHHQKFYESFEKKTRDMATLILADVSLSTEAGITQEIRIIDVIKDGLMVFSESLERLQDTFAIYTFSSLKNTKVFFHIVKNFKDKYNNLIRGRIDIIKPGHYTRLGAAIREATKILDEQQNANKLLLIISDGKPNDLDRYDGRYGIEDTKKAIEEVRQKGITPFCITVDLEAKEYLSYLFGKSGYVVVRDGKKLPKVLPEIYLNLTK